MAPSLDEEEQWTAAALSNTAATIRIALPFQVMAVSVELKIDVVDKKGRDSKYRHSIRRATLI